MTSRAVIARLREDVRMAVASRGNHHHFKHPIKPGRVTVLHPKKDLPTGTLRSIFKQALWSWPP
ncbi:MAG: addiction module toxin, HicA family [Pedosphaera sp.]|nr:addiction module toxin, HicA family [Pedosphaera sp.]